MMLLYVFLAITLLFFFYLGVKSFAKKLCAICLAVSSTWICLLLLYWFGIFNDQIIIGILIGQSILGVYYLVEHNADEKMKIFRLPFLLSLTWVAYALIERSDLATLALLAMLWLIFIVVHYSKAFHALAQKIIACCRDW